MAYGLLVDGVSEIDWVLRERRSRVHAAVEAGNVLIGKLRLIDVDRNAGRTQRSFL